MVSVGKELKTTQFWFHGQGTFQVLQGLDKKPCVGIFVRPGWMRWSCWDRNVGYGKGGRAGTAQTHPRFQILSQSLPIGIHQEADLLLNPFASSQQLQGDPALVVTTNIGVWDLEKGVFLGYKLLFPGYQLLFPGYWLLFPGYWFIFPLGAGGVFPSATLKRVSGFFPIQKRDKPPNPAG